jgi:predicted Fe-S protein YdhL (DUF1289 family)
MRYSLLLYQKAGSIENKIRPCSGGCQRIGSWNSAQKGSNKAVLGQLAKRRAAARHISVTYPKKTEKPRTGVRSFSVSIPFT